MIDKQMGESPVVNHNFRGFRDETMKIFEVQDDKISKDVDIMSLIDESGDKYIETDNIVDMEGEKLPEPLTKDQVRDAKINIINE